MYFNHERMPIKVSIVEDDSQVRLAEVNRIGEAPDLECISSFGSAEDVLAGITPGAVPDVIVMDIKLPNMSGIEAMVRLKEKYPDIKFMMFTIFDDNHVFEALKAGADGYILKREAPEKILQAIREVHDGGAPMSRIIARKVMDSFRPKKKNNASIESLTPRQIEILELLDTGLSYKLIADQLDIAEGTVKQHIHHIYRKLQVNNRTEAINKYLRNK